MARFGQASDPKEIPGCIQLPALDDLSTHFSSSTASHLYIFVQLPPTREHSRHPLILLILIIVAVSFPSLYVCSCSSTSPSMFSLYLGSNTNAPLPRICSSALNGPSPKRRRLGDAKILYTPRMDQASSSTQATKEPPRLDRISTVHAMAEALKPFNQYIEYLASGRFDGYFNSLNPEVPDLELGMELPSELMLLLHDLGVDKDDPRIKRLFNSGTAHLFAPTGSGKTRLSLEGLCHFWGLYISCQGGSAKLATGSRDFKRATNAMMSIISWDATGVTKTIDVSNRAFDMLICARIFVLKQLLTSSHLPLDEDPMIVRRRWVLVQALPPSARDGDIFASIVDSLQYADTAVMHTLSNNMLSEIRRKVGAKLFPDNGLFVVFDEAQVAAQQLTNAFRSSTTGTTRPVLHAFCRFLWEANLIRGVILAGTGLSMQMVQTTMASHGAQSMSPSSSQLVLTEVGRFQQGDAAHRAYIEKYLPPCRNPKSHKRLVQRILYWFSGRYRPTACLLELLRSTQANQPNSQHRILSALVYTLTGFTLTDAIDLEEAEPALTSETTGKMVKYLPISSAERLFQGSNSELVDHLLHVIMRWRIGSQPTTLPMEHHHHKAVELGIGLLERLNLAEKLKPENLPVSLCEPLVVLHLSTVFQKHNHATNATWISNAFSRAHDKPAALGPSFEEATAMVLLQKFGGNPCTLSDVFHCAQPWGSRKATLVALKRGIDGEMQCFPVSWTSGSSDCLGYKATSPSEVLSFFENPRGKVFLFPDHHMGPDLFGFLQDVDSGELTLVGVQAKIKNSLDSATWTSALASVTPAFFYTANTKDGRMQYAPLKYPDLQKDIDDVFNSTLGSDGYTPAIKHTYNLGSYKDSPQNLASRQTPRYLRIIATSDDDQGLRLKAQKKGDDGILRWHHVKEYVGSTAAVVHNTLRSIL
ncbi:hypothetical protein M413DRAFT_446839 [Hebeloma cylindrosporum]|uniref:Uncharacterized protein n=1 Tax=Hebeloma cylindrosporum TaxID=76867 RepID=A0A0C2XQM4_HEBCY|nr:hypothetical protein M413DRAFT_446839 [Hebeloma cylindrosporum h7]